MNLKTEKESETAYRMERQMRVCVTGAGGFISSWLVKLLLSKGYLVHGTLRDPSHEKNSHLRNLDKAPENLQLFKAELNDTNAIAAAISGCDGVFHIASPTILKGVSNLEKNLVNPAMVGTRNVLKACSEASVKRLVVVSSIAAVVVNPDWPQDTAMDESCWSNEEVCRATEEWYILSKTMAEKEAFRYAKESGLDVVTVCPSIVLGPMLQSTVNLSSLFLINILKGFNDLAWTYSKWNFVDVRDLADALLLVYENPEASGRYICTFDSIQFVDFIDLLENTCPGFKYPNKILEVDDNCCLNSEKLKRIGWKHRTLKECIVDSFQYYKETRLVSFS